MSDIKVNSITDLAGAGSPDFPNGLVKFQKKQLGSSVSTTGVISDFTFNGLTVGKYYRYTVSFGLDFSAGRSFCGVDLRENGSVVKGADLFKFKLGESDDIESAYAEMSVIFQATGTSCDVNVFSIAATSIASGSKSTAVLEELSVHTETTDFT